MGDGVNADLVVNSRQTKNVAAIPFLTERLLDLKEDPIVRHEAAEALGAIGDLSSLELLKGLRTGDTELVVRETCEIAVDKFTWENSEEGKLEKLKARQVSLICSNYTVLTMRTVTSHPLTLLRLCSTPTTLPRSRKPCSTLIYLFSSVTEHYLHSATLPLHQIFPPPFQQFLQWRKDSKTPLRSSATKSPSHSDSYRTLLQYLR